MLLADEAAARGQMEALVTDVVADIVDANWVASGADADGSSKLLAKQLQFFPEAKLTAEALGGSRDEARAAASSAALAAKEASLEGTRAGLGIEAMRFLFLVQADDLWKAHMKAMAYVKDFAGLKAYAQLNPLDVYREEGLNLYDAMTRAHRQNTVYSYFMFAWKLATTLRAKMSSSA